MSEPYTMPDPEPLTFRERVLTLFRTTHPFGLDDAFLGYVGSHSHGTYVPPTEPDATDDIDIMGVVPLPARYTLGIDRFTNWNRQHEELDIVVFALPRFIELLMKGNPNVLGLLWLREEDHLYVPSWWRTLRDHRHLFATRMVHTSFAGYASGQLHRMTSYSPAIDAEIETLTATLERAGWHLQEVMDRRSVPMPVGLSSEEANAMANRLRHLRAKYKTAYMGEKRRGLVQRHGYDTKNAAHLIRLLRMCLEFLPTGNLNVYRTHDADELRAIKRGEWALEDVKALAERLFAECRDALTVSTLPLQPDREKVGDLLMQLQFAALMNSAVPSLPPAWPETENVVQGCVR